jgi:molecular chaperone Hsp33
VHNWKVKVGDSLKRFLFEHAGIRGEIVHLDATWRAVLERRDYPPALRTILGESMVAAALMSATLKFAGRLIMQIQGRGPLNLLVVECTNNQTMRAMAQWSNDIPTGPLSLIAEDARLAITLDPTTGRERYQSMVELSGQTISEALENYFHHSEQLETRLWATAGNTCAAGMLLQHLPLDKGIDEEAWARAICLGGTITSKELLTLSAQDIIHRLYHEEDVRVFDSTPVGFRCSCSRDRVVGALRMLGPDEVESIVDEKGFVSVDCEFCNHHYTFDSVDARQLFASHIIPVTPSRVH